MTRLIPILALAVSLTAHASAKDTFVQKFQFFNSGTSFAVGASVTIVGNFDGTTCSGLTERHGNIQCTFPVGTTTVQIDATWENLSFHGEVPLPIGQRGPSAVVNILLQ